jgi:hypothetical protein
MGKFQGDFKIGLRDSATKELIAVYPKKAEGTDAEIEKSVKDWYYKTSCEAEERLLNSYVDILTAEEVKNIKKSDNFNS